MVFWYCFSFFKKQQGICLEMNEHRNEENKNAMLILVTFQLVDYLYSFKHEIIVH